MRQITKPDEIRRRKIEGVYVTSWIIVLNLGGGDYVYIEPAHDYDDGVRLNLDGVASYHYLMEAGIIDQEEKVRLEEAKDAKMEELITTRETNDLRRLMKKYPDCKMDTAETSS